MKQADQTEIYGFGEWDGPAIILVDLDAFFASVEQLDHPAWRGKPVIVGGDADKHGVVSTCSYEARSYGVRSAMAASRARELCPDAIWTGGNFARYREVSDQIMQILRDETPHVQQVSIDEAFCDITRTKTNREHPVSVVNRIQLRVEKLGVTCSIGLGTSKSVAKIASDLDKPRGITIVYPGEERKFLSPIPIRSLSGIGPSAEKGLLALGIKTLGDLGGADESILKKVFGKNAELMRNRALGKDRSVVAADDEVKSVSNEVTFANDLCTREEIDAALGTIASKLGRRLRKKGLKGSTLALKVRYDDRSTRSAQRPLHAATDDEFIFIEASKALVDEVWRPGMKIRLLGLALTNFDDANSEQLSLFDTDQSEVQANAKLAEAKRKQLLTATDKLKDKFGEGAVRFGRELRNEGNTTGSSSKNPADYK